MPNHPDIDGTIQLAASLHADQRDKAGVPYLAHLMAVMRGVPEVMWHVAVLHDAIEDGTITAHRLLALGYSREEVEAIELLTRSRATDGDLCGECFHEHTAGTAHPCLVINCECAFMRDETYVAFIDRIANGGNAMAIAVKIADLHDNLDPRRGTPHDAKREKRYRTALMRLEMLAQ